MAGVEQKLSGSIFSRSVNRNWLRPSAIASPEPSAIARLERAGSQPIATDSQCSLLKLT